MRILDYHIIILYYHNIAFIVAFSIRVFAPEWLHINDFELLRTVSGTEFRRTYFLCWKNILVSRFLCFFWAQAPGARAHGPPWGPWGPAWGMGKATYSQAKLPTVRHAPNNRRHAPDRAIDMHPKAAYMHAKGIDFAPKSIHILCTQQPHTLHPTAP